LVWFCLGWQIRRDDRTNPWFEILPRHRKREGALGAATGGLLNFGVIGGQSIFQGGSLTASVALNGPLVEISWAVGWNCDHRTIKTAQACTAHKDKLALS